MAKRDRPFDFGPVPQPPDWRVDFDALVARWPVLRTLAGVQQDPVHHAEGDVFVHTRMVCEAVASLPAWRALEPDRRAIVFAACLFHDVAKPQTTREEDGRIVSPKHSVHGARLTRRALWSDPTGPWPTFAWREAVARLVRLHGLPLRFMDNADPQRSVLRAGAVLGRCDELAIVAEADAIGRRCAAPGELLDRVGMFRDFCGEQGCFEGPPAFASDHARFVYFAREGPRSYDAFDDRLFDVTLLAGLPGAGKDTWCRAHAAGLPVISLDAVREELDIDPADRQGAVVGAAKDAALDLLRARRSFVWNATNVTRPMRQQLVGLFDTYRARVRIVFVDAPLPLILRRNRGRDRPVPAKVIERLADRLDVPDLTEAHAVEYVDGSQ